MGAIRHRVPTVHSPPSQAYPPQTPTIAESTPPPALPLTHNDAGIWFTLHIVMNTMGGGHKSQQLPEAAGPASGV